MGGLLKAKRPSGRTEKHVEAAAKAVQESGDWRRFNMLMDETELKRLKQYALDHDTSAAEVIREALTLYFQRNEK